MPEQVGNAQEAPESSNVQNAIMAETSDDFFESLDNQVNGGIIDEPKQTTSEKSDNTQSSPDVEVQADDSQGVDNLQ